VESESPSHPDATILMNAAADGDSDAANRLLPIVYEQLRKAAQSQMASERPDHTLSATALVHEAYLKLVGPRELTWQGRAHFYAAAAEAMRRVLLDHARTHGRSRRTAPGRRLDLDAAATLARVADEEIIDHIALDDAICRLAGRDPRAAQVVRLRYYAGLDIADTAQAVGVSERTVKNDWAFARAWLARELAG
jgi:RNA polymerase sigma factor (TIGR02999 family)